jgi:hypothetical protein
VHVRNSHTRDVAIGMALFLFIVSLIRSAVGKAIDTVRKARAINLECGNRELLAIMTHRYSVWAGRAY